LAHDRAKTWALSFRWFEVAPVDLTRTRISGNQVRKTERQYRLD